MLALNRNGSNAFLQSTTATAHGNLPPLLCHPFPARLLAPRRPTPGLTVSTTAHASSLATTSHAPLSCSPVTPNRVAFLGRDLARCLELQSPLPARSPMSPRSPPLERAPTQSESPLWAGRRALPGMMWMFHRSTPVAARSGLGSTAAPAFPPVDTLAEAPKAAAATSSQTMATKGTKRVSFAPLPSVHEHGLTYPSWVYDRRPTEPELMTRQDRVELMMTRVMVKIQEEEMRAMGTVTTRLDEPCRFGLHELAVIIAVLKDRREECKAEERQWLETEKRGSAAAKKRDVAGEGRRGAQESQATGKRASRHKGKDARKSAGGASKRADKSSHTPKACTSPPATSHVARSSKGSLSARPAHKSHSASPAKGSSRSPRAFKSSLKHRVLPEVAKSSTWSSQ